MTTVSKKMPTMIMSITATTFMARTRNQHSERQARQLKLRTAHPTPHFQS
jgi:hypothetical protein